MARRRLMVCGQPGCPELTAGGRCPAHGTPRKQRPSMASLGYDARWQRKSQEYRRAHPTCETPGCQRPSHDVDHVDGLGPLGPQGFDDANLTALCKPHHSAKTALYDGGFGNRPKPRPGGWGTTARLASP